MIGYLVIGLLLMGFLLLVLEWWSRAPTAQAKKSLMILGLVLASGLALLFIARGQWLIGALPLILSFGRFFGLAKLFMRISKAFGRPRTHKHSETGQKTSGSSQSVNLDRKEALEILGLHDPVEEAEVQAAFKRLMAQCHPDKGGSQWMAERLNAARDTLLKG